MPAQTYRFEDGESVIAIDERYAPVYLAAWYGAPTERTAREYFGWTTRVVEEGIRLRRKTVIVVDSEHAGRPNANVRSLMAELSEAVPRSSEYLTVFVALPNPLVRGALTAMQWLTRKVWPYTAVASRTEAITRALDTLRAAGVPAPVGLSPSTALQLGR